MNPAMHVRQTGVSAVLDECMIGLGGLLTGFAAWRYHMVNRAVGARRNRSRPAHGNGGHGHYPDCCRRRDCLYGHFGKDGLSFTGA